MQLFHFADLQPEAVTKIKNILADFPQVKYICGSPFSIQGNERAKHIITTNVKLFYDAYNDLDIQLCRKIAGKLIEADFILTDHTCEDRLILSYDSAEKMILIPTILEMKPSSSNTKMVVTPWEVKFISKE